MTFSNQSSFVNPRWCNRCQQAGIIQQVAGEAVVFSWKDFLWLPVAGLYCHSITYLKSCNPAIVTKALTGVIFVHGHLVVFYNQQAKRSGGIGAHTSKHNYHGLGWERLPQVQNLLFQSGTLQWLECSLLFHAEWTQLLAWWHTFSAALFVSPPLHILKYNLVCQTWVRADNESV